MSWKADGPEGNETAKIHDRIAPYVYGHGVDLGCGMWKLKVESSQNHSVIGIDGGFSPQACKEADIICDVSSLPMFTDECFDYVYSSHTLEDMHYPQAILKEWWRLIKPGGNLILYLPLTREVAKQMGREDWEGFYPNKGELGANVCHQKDLHPADVMRMVAECGQYEILENEVRGEKDEYSFLQVYRKLSSGSAAITGNKPSALSGRRALVVRYGAIGDCIQSVPVFRKLKEEGYHVTVNCSEVAKEVLKHCPYIDELAIQIKDYVPNQGTVSGALVDYWNDLAKTYDKFVNLTGAAEESLLIPDSKLMNMMEEMRSHHPELNEESLFFNCISAIRRKVGDTNYYDNHLAKAGYTDTGMNGELFFTEQEEIMAQSFREKYRDRFTIMWVLSGSSYHKRYPYFQEVAQELIVRNQDVLLISVGDPECALIERAESNRYLPRSGRWQLRTSLVMTKYVDLVVGPETGILNAAGCFDTPKIPFLSHSSHDNLCKYWKNDFCISPTKEEAVCHPCHTLHYVHEAGGKECPSCKGTHTLNVAVPPDKKFGGIWTCPYQVSHGGRGVVAPLCTAIPPERVLARINEVYTKWRAGEFKKPVPMSITEEMCQLSAQ